MSNNTAADTRGVAFAGPVELGPCTDPGLVSVVMPCFNSADFVAEAVHSVLGQTYSRVELLIVDDGSTDNSQHLLADIGARYPDRIHCLSQPNRGPYPARNLGLQKARGEYIAFLDADDYWDPSLLTKLVGRLGSSSSELAYCGWQNVGVDGHFGQPHVPPAYEQNDPIALFLDSCPWPIHAALLRRELVSRLGGFSERRFTSMDFDLWLRALVLRPRMARVEEVLAFYRWHGKGQISAAKSRQVLDAWQVRRDFTAAHPDLVAHISRDQLREKVDGFLFQNALDAYWKRDLATAQTLFRRAFGAGAFYPKHLRHLVPSLLPERLYSALVHLADRRHTQT